MWTGSGWLTLEVLERPILSNGHQVDLAEQRASLFAQDFPVRLEPPPIEGGNLLVAAIGDFRADLATREESKVLRAALKRAADQHPSSRWFASTTRLLRICHVQDEAELPPIWQAMATHGAKLDRNTIQYHLSLDMPDLDSISAPGTASICSPELSKSLGQLTFQTGSDDIQADDGHAVLYTAQHEFLDQETDSDRYHPRPSKFQ